MKEYIISIAAASVISAVTEMIAPESMAKYIKIVTGLIVAVCIAQPVINITKSDILTDISYNTEKTADYGEKFLRNRVKNELESEIGADVQLRLKEEFNKDCTAKVDAAISENGEITGVGRILVYGEKIDFTAVGRLRELYGAEEVKYIGTEKNVKKQE